MNKLALSSTAQQDLIDIKVYIAEDLSNPSAAARITETITKRIRTLIEYPYMGASLASIMEDDEEYRFLVCGRYTAFYRYANETIYVDRILHGNQDFVQILFGAPPSN
jgi:plasmid stabilization system protein ParE